MYYIQFLGTLLVPLILVFVGCSSCGSPSDAEYTPLNFDTSTDEIMGYGPAWDPSLIPDMHQFMDDMERRGVSFKDTSTLNGLHYRSLDGTYLGVCWMLDGVIQISPRVLAYGDAAGTRRATVYHELIHCLFRIGPHDGETGNIFSTYVYTPISDEEWSEQLDRIALQLRSITDERDKLRKKGAENVGH